MDNVRVDIKDELKTRKITQKKIADILGVSPVSVNDVVKGRKKTPRIRAAIALAIVRPVNEIWPEPAEEEK